MGWFLSNNGQECSGPFDNCEQDISDYLQN